MKRINKETFTFKEGDIYTLKIDENWLKENEKKNENNLDPRNYNKYDMVYSTDNFLTFYIGNNTFLETCKKDDIEISGITIFKVRKAGSKQVKTFHKLEKLHKLKESD